MLFWYQGHFACPPPVADVIGKVPFTPGHEMVAEVSLFHLIESVMLRSLMKEIVSASFLVLSLVQIVSAGPGVAAEYTPGKRVCVENHFYCGKCYQCTHGWSGHLGGRHICHMTYLH